ILSGITYLTTEDTRERRNAKSRILKVFVGLVVVLAACPIINYLSHGTRIEEFRCDCPPTPPPRTCYESYPECDGYCPTGYECIQEQDSCICNQSQSTTITVI
ncbi:MAG: hypothetical protein KAU03_00880, partial [Candidatus Altiarchaeales archaeon]|nr:hypothetical protein [Candidatus Altiarchaeales archaeon]